jgi:hypothetical protein
LHLLIKIGGAQNYERVYEVSLMVCPNQCFFLGAKNSPFFDKEIEKFLDLKKKKE